MIVIVILNWLSNSLYGTNFSINLPTGEFWDVFGNIIGFIGYIIPLDTVIAIFSITLGLYVIRLQIAIYKLIPFV